MNRPRIRPESPHRLIVEGIDDKWSIIQLMARHGWDWDNPQAHYPFVDNAGSDAEALDALRIAVRSYRRVGIVLDADLNPANRWAAVCGRIRDSGFCPPLQPSSDGTVIEADDGRRVGVWIMPDNENPGKLEDFLSLLIPEQDACWPLSTRCATEAKAAGAPFATKDLIKAQVHTWLAWQRQPGQPFGTAIKMATLRHDSALGRRFVTWMRTLFEDGQD